MHLFNSNKTPTQFSIYQLKITFKLPGAQAILNLDENTHPPLGFKHLNFSIFSFILHHKSHANNLFNNQKYEVFINIDCLGTYDVE